MMPEGLLWLCNLVMDQEKYMKVLCRMQAKCSRQEMCVSDVRAKVLKAMDGDAEAAERMVESLVGDRFVDDGRYAAAYAREKSSLSGWGAQKISFMLAHKGIDRKVIAEALEEVDADAAAKKLESVVAAKYRLVSEEPQCRLKLLKFAMGRGYGYDEVRAAVDRVMKGED